MRNIFKCLRGYGFQRTSWIRVERKANNLSSHMRQGTDYAIEEEEDRGKKWTDNVSELTGNSFANTSILAHTEDLRR